MLLASRDSPLHAGCVEVPDRATERRVEDRSKTRSTNTIALFVASLSNREPESKKAA
jgi:hypothetical protein